MISPLKRIIVLPSFVATLLKVAAEAADGTAQNSKFHGQAPSRGNYFRSQIESMAVRNILTDFCRLLKWYDPNAENPPWIGQHRERSDEAA